MDASLSEMLEYILWNVSYDKTFKHFQSIYRQLFYIYITKDQVESNHKTVVAINPKMPHSM